jgi:hypothetical protein
MKPMKNDTLTRILLALIALGLWMNLFRPVEPPTVAEAAVQEDATTLERMEVLLANIDENLEIITLGSCMNPRLC